jgi:transcriptional regulator with XRE-family HTH domain
VRHELSGIVGRIIARHRAAMGITQEQLSLALDVDPITISRFERGVSLPSLTTIQRLCEIFGISLGQFFSESGEPGPTAAAGETGALLAMFDSLQKDERLFVIDTLKRFCRLSAKRRRR